MTTTDTADDPRLMTQAQLARLLGVDRTTITQAQREGLPYQPASRGRSARYNATVALYWVAGRGIARRDDLTGYRPLELVLLGSVAAAVDDWGRLAHDLAEAMGASEAELAQAIGWVRGTGYLR